MGFMLKTDVELSDGNRGERELFYHKRFCTSQISSHVNILPIQKLIY